METRDSLAAAALTGLLANPQHLIKGCLTDELQFKYEADWYAEQAYDLADAMMKERQRRHKEEIKKRGMR